jgi:hypothetical protein
MNEEVNLNLKYNKELISIRRAKVLELTAQGLVQSEIAKRLSVSQAVVSLDMQCLRETAKSSMKTHIEERIPMQYEECLTGLKLILRKIYEIIGDKSKKSEEQLAAMNLAVNIYGKLMDLSTNGAILEKTLAWVEDRKKLMLTPEEEKQMQKVLTSKDEEGEEDVQEQSEESND